MALVHYTEAFPRFSHLDADLVRFKCRFPEREAELTVRFYPWWEHPGMVEARDSGRSWQFSPGAFEEGARNVTVFARGLHEVRMGETDEVEEWTFSRESPLLWKFEDRSNLTCNDSLTLDQCFDAAVSVAKALRCDALEVLEHLILENVRRFGSKPPFSLGALPRPVFLEMRGHLTRIGVDTFAAREPRSGEVPVLFETNNGEWLIADDFELEVPEFVHRDEWLQVQEK